MIDLTSFSVFSDETRYSLAARNTGARHGVFPRARWA